MSNYSDTPSELIEQSDGVTDDGALDEEIIGACNCVGSGLRQHLVVSGTLQHVSVAGLGDLAIAGLPSYLFTRKNLSNPVARRRIAASIKAMTPKLRRRVLGRLRAAVSASRHLVSGVVTAYPSVAGGGWQGITVSGRRSGGCPYANVAGALTP